MYDYYNNLLLMSYLKSVSAGSDLTRKINNLTAK